MPKLLCSLMGLLNLSETGLILKQVSIQRIKHQKATVPWDFPGSPVVETSPSNAGSEGLISGQRAKIPHALWPKDKNIKQKQYCNKLNKDFKHDVH